FKPKPKLNSNSNPNPNPNPNPSLKPNPNPNLNRNPILNPNHNPKLNSNSNPNPNPNPNPSLKPYPNLNPNPIQNPNTKLNSNFNPNPNTNPNPNPNPNLNQNPILNPNPNPNPKLNYNSNPNPNTNPIGISYIIVIPLQSSWLAYEFSVMVKIRPSQSGVNRISTLPFDLGSAYIEPYKRLAKMAMHELLKEDDIKKALDSFQAAESFDYKKFFELVGLKALSAENVKKVFKVLDVDGSGFIEEEELM
ncbi:hypothetical protein NFI96_007358, partial [Prochilodus magdalenae]